MSIADDRVRYQSLRRLTAAFEAKLAAGTAISELSVGSIHTYARNRSEAEKLASNPNLFPAYTAEEKATAEAAVASLKSIGLPVPEDLLEILKAPLKP